MSLPGRWDAGEPLALAGWLDQRARRVALCHGALAAPALQTSALAAWSLPPASLASLLADWAVPPGPDIDRLCVWVHGDGPAAPPPQAAEVVYDRLAAAGTAERAWSAEDRAVAGLYLLSRLGDELALRERGAPARAEWLPDERDAAAAEVWSLLLGPSPDLRAGARFKTLWGGRVRGAFRGVAAVLGLPEEVGRSHAASALEQLDLVAAGAHQELVGRLIETAGEPVAALDAALTAAGRQRVAACISARGLLRDLGALLPAGSALQRGADLVAFARLAVHLRAGRARPHELGLPGWGVVVANRSRLRGRLRAIVGEDPAAMAAAVLRLPALHARTAAAVSRFAWAWAWREARDGFAFDLGQMLSAPCQQRAAAAAPLAPLGPLEEPAIVGFLLVVLGRGCWADLEQWVGAGAGRELSRTFYRCLDQLPDRVADPLAADARSRSYERLREHLDDGGILELTPALRALAARVAAVPSGRGLREELQGALAPDWPATGLPMPAHHLARFQLHCAAFLASAGDPTAT